MAIIPGRPCDRTPKLRGVGDQERHHPTSLILPYPHLDTGQPRPSRMQTRASRSSSAETRMRAATSPAAFQTWSWVRWGAVSASDGSCGKTAAPSQGVGTECWVGSGRRRIRPCARTARTVRAHVAAARWGRAPRRLQGPASRQPAQRTAEAVCVLLAGRIPVARRTRLVRQVAGAAAGDIMNLYGVHSSTGASQSSRSRRIAYKSSSSESSLRSLSSRRSSTSTCTSWTNFSRVRVACS